MGVQGEVFKISMTKRQSKADLAGRPYEERMENDESNSGKNTADIGASQSKSDTQMDTDSKSNAS